jgi:hypothetical protein|tara:strand:- start:15156 stop:15614 length:459 start_codon:yes stop_codon:yes gene_type:complete
MSTFQKKLQQDRTNEQTSNAGLKWEPEDDKYLIEKASEGIKLEEIAKILKRTEGSIRTRLVIYVLNNCSDNKENLNLLVDKYNITLDDVKTYESKKAQRDERKQKKTQYSKEYNSSFPSSEVVEILDGMTQLSKKMDTLLEKQNEVLKKIVK